MDYQPYLDQSQQLQMVQFMSTADAQEDWRSMTSAPHDGTIIEIRCTYGVAPWYGLYHWVAPTMSVQDQDGHWTKSTEAQKRWAKVGDDYSGFSEGGSFSWRPYSGSATQYVDPTGGAQNTAYYWRRAAALQKGLPGDYFEAEVYERTKNSPAAERAWIDARPPAPKPTLWERFWSLF